MHSPKPKSSTPSCIRSCDGMPSSDTPSNTQKVALASGVPSTASSAKSQIESSPNPVPYTFRVPVPRPDQKSSRRNICTQHAKPPPFCLQLDHTIAVLWFLFRRKAKKLTDDQTELGVGQLQWALYFLKGIKPPNGGDRAEDVSVAIQAVEDALLDLYADMCDVVMNPPNSDAAANGGCPISINTSLYSGGSQPPCSICEREKLGLPANLSWVPEPAASRCNICSSVSLGTNKGQGRPRKVGKEKESQPASIKSSKYQTTQSAPPQLDWCQSEDMPFRPPPGSTPPPGTCTRDRDLEIEIRQLKKAAAALSRRSPESCQSSQTDVAGRPEFSMLQEWRKEQVGRVQEELRRLRSLDSAIGMKTDVTEVAVSKYECFKPPASSSRHTSVSR